MSRIVFMGSPEFAVPSLRALAREHDVVGVVTQPDRRAGRGRELKAPAIKLEAATLHLPTIQPSKLTESAALKQIRDWKPDLIVVAAFGQLLRPEMLAVPQFGCLNVHASLLPRWRGAAPIQAAIAAGDAETGVTIMKMDPGMDTGGIVSQRSIPIESEDTGGSLAAKLAQLGAQLLSATLGGYLSGVLRPQPQDGRRATKAPSLKKEDGLLDPSLPADVLERRVRAFNPWPGAYIMWQDEALKVHRATARPTEAGGGTRMVVDGLPAVATADGALILQEVQAAGRKAVDGRAFLTGIRNQWQ